MTKNFLSWMSAGIGAILASTLSYFMSGNPVTFKSVVTVLGTALLLRAASWVVANFGPKPTTSESASIPPIAYR